MVDSIVGDDKLHVPFDCKVVESVAMESAEVAAAMFKCMKQWWN